MFPWPRSWDVGTTHLQMVPPVGRVRDGKGACAEAFFGSKGTTVVFGRQSSLSHRIQLLLAYFAECKCCDGTPTSVRSSDSMLVGIVPDVNITFQSSQ